MGNFKSFGVQYRTQGSRNWDILSSSLTLFSEYNFVGCLKEWVPRFLGLSAFISPEKTRCLGLCGCIWHFETLLGILQERNTSDIHKYVLLTQKQV